MTLRLYIASIASALGYVAVRDFAGNPISVVLKVGSIALLLVIAIKSRADRRLRFALSASIAGDFFLGINQLGPLGLDTLFQLGLASFLVAHLFLIALFRRERSAQPVSIVRRAFAVAIAIVPFPLLAVLWTALGPLRLPVVVYALALCTMAITAQWSRYDLRVALGAVSFVASDSILAFEHFKGTFAASAVIVWATYVLAQALITSGVVAGQSASANGSIAGTPRQTSVSTT